MTGIRKRITIGFLGIVTLLFFSGMVSLFELSHMSVDIEAILVSSRKSIEESKNIIDALHVNDRAVVNYAVLRDSTYVEQCKSSYDELGVTVRRARAAISSSDTSILDSLDQHIAELGLVIDAMLAGGDNADAGSQLFDGRKWYDDNYEPVYNKISDGIIRVMSLAQSSLTPRAEQLNRNAYRSVTPVFISLVVMIVILLMFYYFIMIYTVKPIVGINQELARSLRYKTPYSMKAECRDEIKELNEKIEVMINNPKAIK